MSGEGSTNRFQITQQESIQQFDRNALQALLQPAQCNRFYIQALPDRVSLIFGAVGPGNDVTNNPVACSTISSAILINRQLAVDLTVILSQALKISDQELADSRQRHAGMVATAEAAHRDGRT